MSAAPATVKDGNAAAAGGKYLTFTLDQELLALSILRVKEILGYREPTAIMRMPPQVRGVINLRGTVIPILDLDVRFGHAPRPVGKRSCILIVEADSKDQKHTLGIVVDAVNEVMPITEAEVGPVPEFGGTIRAQFLRGLTRKDGRFVALLDGDRVFDVGELTQLMRQDVRHAGQ